MSVEEPIECPLCMEPLEIDDINFFPCTCGYQICRFCWHRIRTNENGLCPACRKQYPEDPAEFKPLTEDELQRIKKERRQKDLQRKQKAAENRKHLANVRVVQKNLVFVVGLSPRLSDPEVLKKQEYFGKFGKIHKVVISQSASYAGSQVGRGPSASAYVTYIRSDDALRAILAVNNKHIDGRTLKTSLGTTKYCSHFLKGSQCPKSDCMYLHELGEEAASFTKEHMQMGKHQEYEQKLLEQFLNSQNASTSQLHVNSNTKQSRKKNTSPLTLQQQPSSQQQQPQHHHQKQSTQPSNQNQHQPNQRQPQQQHPPPSSTSPKELWPSLNNGTVGNNNNKGNDSGAGGGGGKDGGSPTVSHSHNASSESNSSGAPGHSRSGSGNQKSRSISENSALLQVKTNSDSDTSHILTQAQTQQTSQHSPEQMQQQVSPPLCNNSSLNPAQNRQHSSLAMPVANLPPPPPAPPSDSNHSTSKQPQQLSSAHYPRPNYEQQILSGSRLAAPPGLTNQQRAMVLAQHNNSLSLFTTGNGFTSRMQPKPLSTHVINSETLPSTEIPDTIAVSSSTDWQAAFGFGSQQKDVLDDDLGFDPWDESSKGLADLIEKENSANCIQQNPYNVHTLPPRMPNGLHHPHMFGSMERPPLPLPPHATAQMAQQQAAAVASGANMPSIPPGFSPNFLNQYRQQMQQHQQQQQFIRADGGGSRMMNFMNLPPRVPPPPQNSFAPDPMQQSKEPPGPTQDWQDGLRALLPNINISFGGQSQQQVLSSSAPSTSIMNGTVSSSHIEPHKGPLQPESPPHWMKSLHQLTESDSPSPNHRLPFAQQFIGNSNWTTHNHNNPPPGFQAIRSQSTEQAHTILTDTLQ